MSTEPTDRERSLELLNSVHEFPGTFQFRVVVHPGTEHGVVSAMCACVEAEDAVVAIDTRTSRNGTYLSVRATLAIQRAEEVLEVYQVLKTVDGVVTVL